MKSKIMIAALVLFVAGAIAGYFWLSNYSFSAREEPSWMEKMMARQARKIATPAGAKAMKNPFPLTEAGMAEAREHFVEHCSVCHGIDGRGKTVIGRNLYPKVPDLLDADLQQLTDGELFHVISNGIRLTGMPAWGGEDSPESMWALVALVRLLPKLSPEEIKQMQEMAAGAGGHGDGVGHGQEMKMDKKSEEKGVGEKGQGAGEGGRKPVRPHQHGSGTPPHLCGAISRFNRSALGDGQTYFSHYSQFAFCHQHGG